MTSQAQVIRHEVIDCLNVQLKLVIVVRQTFCDVHETLVPIFTVNGKR